jgi:4-oxalocrotonate tautomerase
MPHVNVKMLGGRTEEVKKRAAEAIKLAVINAVGVGDNYVSVTIEDITPAQLVQVHKDEIEGNKNCYIKPSYNPKDFL